MKVSPAMMAKCLKQAGIERDLTVVRVPIPPSVNNLFVTSGNRRIASREYKGWIERVLPSFQALKIPTELPAKVLVRISGKIRRSRDLDNFLKPIGDALVRGGVLPDDSVKAIRGWEIWYVESEKDKNPIATVYVTPWSWKSHGWCSA